MKRRPRTRIRSKWKPSVTQGANDKHVRQALIQDHFRGYDQWIFLVVPLMLVSSIILVRFMAGATGGNIYFVDSAAGSDSNNGTSSSTPWKTLAKVNAQSIFQPGDTISFKCGSTWNEMLTLRNSGNSTSPLTVTQYGSCTGSNRPIFAGGGSGFAGLQVAFSNSYVTFSNLELANWTSGDGVYMVGSDHVTFDNLYIHNNGTGIITSASGTGDTNTTVKNTTITGLTTGSQSIEMAHHGSTGWLYQNDDMSNNGDSCIIDEAGFSTYDNVTVHHCGIDATISVGKHGIYAKGPQITIKNSTIYDITGGSCTSPREGGLIQNNVLHACSAGVGWFDYTRAASQTLNVDHNLVYDVSTAGMYIDFTSNNPSGNPLNVNGHTMNFNFSNNTFITNTVSGAIKQGVDIRGPDAAGLTTNVNFENNIIVGNMGTNTALQVFSGSATGSYTGRNNMYFDTSGGTTFSFRGSSVALASFPGESGSSITNPLLTSIVATSPDATLTSSSPAIDFGVANPATGTLTSGCSGALTSYCGSAPDAGAKEFVPAGSPIPGDLNNSGHVDIFDLSLLLSKYGTSDATADINNDNTVDIFDLSILLSHYGT